MKARLICLVRRHQWHNGWDEDRHVTVWTCKRCGATGVPTRRGTLASWPLAAMLRAWAAVMGAADEVALQ
jgi:hypothetical protein